MVEKSLLKSIKKSAGRSHGKITVRHRGGGHKRLYRVIDFKRWDKKDIPARVASIEYDPNRSADIALLTYQDGEKRYILAPAYLKVGALILTADKTPLEPGNAMLLKNIPVGTQVHNISLQPGQPARLVRSAGSYATVQAHLDSGYSQLQLPSKEVRLIPSKTFATIGQISNPDHSKKNLRKAGARRHRGWRPTVRGSAMSPKDHPHGGGEGRAGIGLKSPKTPWGKIARGVKTRRRKKPSNKFIINRRK